MMSLLSTASSDEHLRLLLQTFRGGFSKEERSNALEKGAAKKITAARGDLELEDMG